IWDAVNKNYSNLENAAQVFEIKSTLKDLHQGSMDITEYYNELQMLWLELDLHYEADWEGLDGNQKLKKHLEKERLYEFLASLNRELDEVHGRVLGYRPLPSIDDAFAEVRREVSRRRVMLGEQKDSPIITNGNKPIETMALAVKNNFDRFNGEQKNSQKNGRPWCNHCNKLGHTRDTCWDIHGKPANWKRRGLNRSKGFQVSVEEKEGTRAQNESNGAFLSKAQF
ncbi:UBN2_3 domain-containing protein, partial [Cephalotus follicularis]